MMMTVHPFIKYQCCVQQCVWCFTKIISNSYVWEVGVTNPLIVCIYKLPQIIQLLGNRAMFESRALKEQDFLKAAFLSLKTKRHTHTYFIHTYTHIYISMHECMYVGDKCENRLTVMECWLFSRHLLSSYFISILMSFKI